MVSHPRLSLCMIVKNEAKTLEKCLQYARPHVDEMVIIDTGSTDGTQEIARRYADIYEEIEWPNSFAKARNYSFDKATGDYILILDGDEYIPEEEHWHNIRRAIRQPNLACLLAIIVNVMEEGSIMHADRIRQERVVRNDPRIRYLGRVHNQIQESIRHYMAETGTRQVHVQAEVIHTGYALPYDALVRKYTPRLELLHAEYEQPRSPKYRAYYGYQLGVSYYVLKDYEAASKVFHEIDYRLLNSTNAFYTHLLASQSAIQLKHYGVALTHANHMLTLDRTEPIAYYATAVALLWCRRISDGLLMLTKAYELNTETNGHRYALNPYSVLKLLGDLCMKLGIQDFGLVFLKIYEKKSYNPRVVLALLDSLRVGLVNAERAAAG